VIQCTFEHTPKDDVFAIEPRCGLECDEKLAVVCVEARVCHGQQPLYGTKRENEKERVCGRGGVECVLIVMKNWMLFVLRPEFAIDSDPCIGQRERKRWRESWGGGGVRVCSLLLKTGCNLC